MSLRFVVSEDDLTNALFHGSAFHATGSGTKAEARAQARAMLAGPTLLERLQQLTPLADGALGWLNAFHGAVDRDDVLATAVPSGFGRQPLCQAIADAHRAIAQALPCDHEPSPANYHCATSWGWSDGARTQGRGTGT